MDARIDTLLARKVLGTITPDEERELQAWIDADPRRGERVQALLDAARPGPVPRREDGVDASWERVRARIEGAEVTPLRSGRPSLAERLRRVRPARLRIAAVLAVGFAATLSVAASSSNDIVEVAPVSDREVLTERGERRPVVLPDGSRVTLAPESRMGYASAFDPGGRRVEIEGRAFFDVVPDPARPFRVRTATARVTVLGTRFDLRAYPGEDAARVAVQEGSVALADAGEPDDTGGVVLQAGDLGRLAAGADAPLRVRGGADERHFGWLQGRLVFRDEPLSDVLDELARFYDIAFTAPDDVLVRRVSFTIDDQPRSDVLELLSLLLDLRVRTEGDRVRLESRNGAP